jgi:hypothetical protein
VIALFVAATIVFSAQNFQVVTMSFLSFSARAPTCTAGAYGRHYLLTRHGDGRQPFGGAASVT